MDLSEFGRFDEQGKLRIVQESVPGKQVTLAHIIAHPDTIIYKKLGLNPDLEYQQAAIAILSMIPSEISVVAGDVAFKTAPVDIGFIDRFSGTLIFTGKLSSVKSAMDAVLNYLQRKLGFTVCEMTFA